MDPEQTFLRVHARLSGMLSQLLTPRIRLALEYLYLAGAVALFCLLVVMHTNFVQQPGCSSEFSGIEFGEAQLVQIKIISGGLWASKGASYIMDLQNLGRSAEKILEVNGDKFNILASKFWSTWVGPGARKRVPVPELKTTGEGSVHHPLSAKESFKAAVTYLFRKWYSRVILFWRNIKQVSDNTLQLMVRSNWNDFLHIIKDLQLPSIDNLLSTIDYFVTKCGVLLMSLFVFFTTTMSVSFTLRETQSRMLRFTVQLQHHARHQLPTFQLIFVHVIESLVFVPIMIGILFFLFEFYDDQLLAFLVLTLVWLCELFTMIRLLISGFLCDGSIHAASNLVLLESF
ncbi:hypothetical protein ACQ4PT_032498 [Festuca glaucescens]